MPSIQKELKLIVALTQLRLQRILRTIAQREDIIQVHSGILTLIIAFHETFKALRRRKIKEVIEKIGADFLNKILDIINKLRKDFSELYRLVPAVQVGNEMALDKYDKIFNRAREKAEMLFKEEDFLLDIEKRIPREIKKINFSDFFEELRDFFGAEKEIEQEFLNVPIIFKIIKENPKEFLSIWNVVKREKPEEIEFITKKSVFPSDSVFLDKISDLLATSRMAKRFDWEKDEIKWFLEQKIKGSLMKELLNLIGVVV